jgi:hypothetical protein
MSEPGTEAPVACPARHAHQRLIDCHELWHAAEREYMDPEGFRLNLNSLIQNLRNVTWLLQKQKSTLLNFNTWYPAWRTSVSTDPVMKWLVRARNRIVKEADLELLSSATLSVSIDWLNAFEAHWTMPPRYTTRNILIRLLSTQQLPSAGLVTIERRWVDRNLPDEELLGALAHAYAQISHVVAIAHDQNEARPCDLAPRSACVTPSLGQRRLACMQSWDDKRRLHINLANRVEVSETTEIVPNDPKLGVLARDRYGDVPMTGDPISRVLDMLETNKRMLIADKSLATVALLFSGERMFDIYVLDFFDQASKRIAMQRVADRMRLFRADGLMLISEAWMAELDPDEILTATTPPARARANRTEAIQVLAITRDGRKSDATCLFSRRQDGEVILGDTLINVFGEANLLEPIRRSWTGGK